MKVLVLFFCSGATALVYEVLWSKYLSLTFGSTVQAQTAVLAVFMGGLALGNHLFGRRSAAIAKPLMVYGLLEVIIGLFGFFFNLIYQAADHTFVTFGQLLFEHSILLLLWKIVLGVILLAVPTVLMGGTLPLLAAWLDRQKTDSNRMVARFYSVNSLGAVLGAGLAGFLMVPSWGTVATLQLTALVNAFVGFGAMIISRGEPPLQTAPIKQVQPPESTDSSRFVTLLVAATGGISMGLEILSSRAVALIVGGSLQAFAIVLIAFIAGIGLGSAFVSSPRISSWNKKWLLYGLLALASIWVASIFGFIEEWTILYSRLRYSLASNGSGYFFYQLIVTFIAIGVLGLPAAFIGAVLPLIIRTHAPENNLPEFVGRLLTWNTIGSVVGVMITGFILMPALGLRASFVLAAMLLAFLLGFVAIKEKVTLLAQGAFGLAALWLVFGWIGGEDWRYALGSGMYRMHDIVLTHEKIAMLHNETRFKFYKDGADATVAVEAAPIPEATNQLILRINGKTDASTYGDLGTQLLVGHLPFLAKPDSKEVFVFGFGSGITCGAVLGHPINGLTVAENCRPVLEAAYLFEPWNRKALHNPKTKVVYEDARTVLKLSPRKYDIIISEPSNPWVAGISAVFSAEFYSIAAARLNDGGIMAQWFHIYEMNEDVVSMVIRTFQHEFPNMELWDTEGGDIVLLGSKKPWDSSIDVYQKVYDRSQPEADLTSISLPDPITLLARQAVSQRTSPALLTEGPIESDAFPRLEYAAPKAFFIGVSADRIFDFDERCREFPLAPAEKFSALRSLSEAEILDIFRGRATCNKNLYQYLKGISVWIYYNTRPPLEIQPDPILFRPISRHPNPPIVVPSATNNEKILAECEYSFITEPEKWPQAVEAIGEVIKDMKRDERPNDKTPQYYAAVAARACLGHGNFERAKQFIEQGLQYDRADPELAYLSRICILFKARESQAAQPKTPQSTALPAPGLP